MYPSAIYALPRATYLTRSYLSRLLTLILIRHELPAGTVALRFAMDTGSLGTTLMFPTLRA